MNNGGFDHTQEWLIGELLRAGAVYEQEYQHPVNYDGAASRYHQQN